MCGVYILCILVIAVAASIMPWWVFPVIFVTFFILGVTSKH